CFAGRAAGLYRSRTGRRGRRGGRYHQKVDARWLAGRRATDLRAWRPCLSLGLPLLRDEAIALSAARTQPAADRGAAGGPQTAHRGPPFVTRMGRTHRTTRKAWKHGKD